MLDKLLALIAPHSCIVCNREGSLICEWCQPDVICVIPSRCFACRIISDNFQVCAKCRKQVGLKNVWVATEYTGFARMLVKKLKFERTYAAADHIGTLLADILPYLDNTVITHVPTATARRRQRGYDQAELIARALARQTGLPHLTLLARTGQSRQVGSDRAQRTKQLEGSFRAIRTDKLANRHVLVVDDIVTTGATLQAAAKTLKKSGVRHVYAAVFAQKS